MTKKELKKLSKKLAEEVLKEWEKNPDLSFKEILKKLEVFNEEVEDGILEEIIKYEIAFNVASTASTLPFKKIKLKLSDILYNNAKQTAKAAEKVINDYNEAMSTINDLREALYDGYGYNDKEILDIKKDLPGFLQKEITQAKIDRLKTKSLKAAYMDRLEEINKGKTGKAFETLIEEKSRYYATRVAFTEQQKAFNLANAAKMLEDGIEFVRWTLSPRHSVPCICDYFANKDIGYGPGISPILSAPMPVYSSHPFCQCRLVPTEPIKSKKKWKPTPQEEKYFDYNQKGGWKEKPVKYFF